MSTGNRLDWRIVDKAPTLNQKEKDELLDIVNFKQFLNEYYQEAVKAAEHCIKIQIDVPFLRIQGKDIDFILGDMDQLVKSEEDKSRILKENIQNMHSRLVSFFEDIYAEAWDGSSDTLNAGYAEKYIEESSEYIFKNFQFEVTRYKQP